MGDATRGRRTGEADTVSEVDSMLREGRANDPHRRGNDDDDASDEEEAFTSSVRLRAMAADRHEWGT